MPPKITQLLKGPAGDLNQGHTIFKANALALNHGSKSTVRKMDS